jgi:hypothetical protein
VLPAQIRTGDLPCPAPRILGRPRVPRRQNRQERTAAPHVLFGNRIQKVSQMTKTSLLFSVALILASSSQAFAGSGQNGPIGPGSRYGLEPSGDDATTGISGYNSHAAMAEVPPGTGYEISRPRYMHRRHHSR